MHYPYAARAGACVIAVTCFVPVLAQDHPPEPHRHPEAQALENPAEYTPDSVAAGAAIYDRFCDTCHGSRGHGDGRLAAGAAAYGPRPSNLADPTWQHGSSDGEIFDVIRDGIEPDFFMDAFGGTISDEDIWHLVNHIRSFRR